jgi:hypothetical protein
MQGRRVAGIAVDQAGAPLVGLWWRMGLTRTRLLFLHANGFPGFARGFLIAAVKAEFTERGEDRIHVHAQQAGRGAGQRGIDNRNGA